MTTSDLTNGAWFMSSHSNGQGACVEVAITRDHVTMRDSKNRRGPTLTFTTEAWSAFIHATVLARLPGE